jgi:hypothetical protein
MMTLDDLTRDRTREIADTIKLTDEQVRKLEGEKATAEVRASQLREKSARNHPVVEERERAVREAQARIRDIERQIAELDARLKARRQEMDNAAALARETRDQVTDLQKQERLERDVVSGFDDKIASTRTELAVLNRRLGESRLAALADYNDGVWAQVVSVATSFESKKAAFEARAALDRARDTDPAVGSLVEARDEWMKILKSAVPPLVKETATSALSAVEAKLEHMFPGALSSDASGVAEEAIWLYYERAEEAGAVDVFIPLPGATWEAIAAGRSSETERLAMEFVWALSAGFPKRQHLSEFGERAGLRVLRVTVGENVLADKEVRLSLPPAATVAFYFSPLPGELQEVLRHAYTHA